MINPVTGWFEVTNYDKKCAINPAELLETTQLNRHPCTMVIMYDQGSEFIGHDFRKFLVEEEYGIKSKPSSSGNPTSNAILEIINLVLCNLVWKCNIEDTYADKYKSWMGILSSAYF